MTLHHRQIQNLDKGYHSDGGGLRFFSDGNGGGRWTVRYRANGKAREKGLGAFPEVSLKMARDAAQMVRHDAKKGIDHVSRGMASDGPVRLGDAPTVRQLARVFLPDHITTLRESGRAQYANHVNRHILPHFGDILVSELSLFDLKAAFVSQLRDHFKSRKNTLEVLSTMLGSGRRSGLPCTELLVSDFKKERVYLAAKEIYDTEKEEGLHTFKSLEWDEWPTLYATLGESDLPSLAAKLIFQTAARVSTVLRIERDQTGGPDLQMRSAQMKSKKAHTYPLSTEAQRIVRCARALADPDAQTLFEGVTRGAIWNAVKHYSPKANLHGVRHGVTDWAIMNGVSDEIADKMLAHAGSKSIRQQHYQSVENLAPLRDAYEAWATHLTSEYLIRVAA